MKMITTISKYLHLYNQTQNVSAVNDATLKVSTCPQFYDC